ncbi:alpha/beta-hydrolase [Massarina eburnea CBS 473.64]|uniref:Alpha/beta-hydrolase n=1 Tax=Massarina eburnea CBS 473.64 TaxID=1395130 RepID=A0A6A6RIM3_9PLEO|nr:alpha/beta-hydrolase [Massarina eburnea CBS 473.64]
MRISSIITAHAALSLQLLASCTPTGPNSNQSIVTKELTTSDGQTYVYDFTTAKNSSKPTLLLLHGYPASRHDWEQQITALAASGFGVIAPDLLGFGDSSKPTDLEAYNLKTLSDHLAQILDKEGLRDVVGVGHDWGANVLSRAVAWHPERFAKLVFVTVPYQPAGQFFDVDAANKGSLETVGYQRYAYWYFFNSWDAAELMGRYLESFFHLAFHTNASAWGVDFTDLGSARTWLNANTTTELPSWLSTDYKTKWLHQYSQPNALETSLNYYKALMRGIHAADESVLTDEDRTLRVPVLAVGAAKDLISDPEGQKIATEQWASAGFEQRVVDAGHWIAVEKGEELSRILIEFAGSG